MEPSYKLKYVRAITKALEPGLIQAVVSSERKDRDGDIIRAAGWDLADFLRHPVLLSSHNYNSLRSQIGHWESMEVKGKKLVGVARYYVGKGNDEADWGYQLAEMGQAAYSVGFAPDLSKAKELENPDSMFPSFEYAGQSLWEVSQVVIPANPDALQGMKAAKLHPVLAELVEELLADAPSVAATVIAADATVAVAEIVAAEVPSSLRDEIHKALKDILPPLLRELMQQPQPKADDNYLPISSEELKELLRQGAIL